MERIRAEIEVTKKRTALECTKSLLMKQHQRFFELGGGESPENQRRLSELRKQLILLKSANSKLMDVTIFGIVNELAKLQSTPILWGDYNLKIARQHFHIYKQNKVWVIISRAYIFR